MSEKIGRFCEGVVWAALKRSELEWTHHDTTGAQEDIDCLDECRWANEHCRGRAPRLRIEPDFTVRSTVGPVFVYVTHADSSNIYNFKLWRTLGEILEQRKYVQDAACVDLLFGRIREKQEVRRGFELITDRCFVLGEQLFPDAKQQFEDECPNSSRVEDVAKWAGECGQRTPVGALVDEVYDSLRGLSDVPRTIETLQLREVFRSICRDAKWHAEVGTSEAGGFARTGAIVGVVALMAECRSDATAFAELLQSRTTRQSHSLPPDYRMRAGKLIPAWSWNKGVGGTRIRFAADVQEAIDVAGGPAPFSTLCEEYARALQADETWQYYLRYAASWKRCRKIMERTLAAWSSKGCLIAFLAPAMSSSRHAGVVEGLAISLGKSMNWLSHYLEDKYRDDGLGTSRRSLRMEMTHFTF